MCDAHEANRLAERYYQRELDALRHKARRDGIATSSPIEWARWLERPSGEVGPMTATGIRLPLSHRAALEHRCAAYRRALLAQEPPLAANPAMVVMEVSATHAPAIEIKSAPPLALKASPDTGSLVGYLSTWSVDSTGDQIERGAYARTIAEAKTNGRPFMWPLLWSHRPDEPIGGISDAVEDGRGLRIKASIDASTRRGREVLSGIAQGYIRGLSIGFTPVRYSYRGDVRVLHEIRLMEGSLCVFPAQPDAEVTALE